jgi:Nuclease-related domain
VERNRGKIIRLRYPATCADCGRALPRGVSATWDATAKAATCVDCVRVTTSTTSPVDAPTAEAPAVFDAGIPGASAHREHARRKERYEERTRQAHPIVGEFVLRFRKRPGHIDAWGVGGDGEVRLGDRLDLLRDDGVVAIHDRRVPATRANIDHIVVSATGVYVVDAKRYKGKKVERREAGGWFRTDLRLNVGGRDGTKLIAGMARQVEAVRDAIGGRDVPIQPVVCFIDADWGWFAQPFTVDGVLVCWPKALLSMLRESGPIEPGDADDIARAIATALHSA